MPDEDGRSLSLRNSQPSARKIVTRDLSRDKGRDKLIQAPIALFGHRRFSLPVCGKADHQLRHT